MYEQEGRNNSPGDLGTKRVKKILTWGTLGKYEARRKKSTLVIVQSLDPLLSGWSTGIEKSEKGREILN